MFFFPLLCPFLHSVISALRWCSPLVLTPPRLTGNRQSSCWRGQSQFKQVSPVGQHLFVLVRNTCLTWLAWGMGWMSLGLGGCKGWVWKGWVLEVGVRGVEVEGAEWCGRAGKADSCLELWLLGGSSNVTITMSTPSPPFPLTTIIGLQWPLSPAPCDGFLCFWAPKDPSNTTA